MEHDDIIRMAHEADCLDTQHYGTIWVDKLIRFAELVAAAEREACAKVCDGIDRRYINRRKLNAFSTASCLLFTFNFSSNAVPSSSLLKYRGVWYFTVFQACLS